MYREGIATQRGMRVKIIKKITIAFIRKIYYI